MGQYGFIYWKICSLKNNRDNFQGNPFNWLNFFTCHNQYFNNGYNAADFELDEEWLNLEKEFGHIIHDYTIKIGPVHQAKIPNMYNKNNEDLKIKYFNNYTDLDNKLEILVAINEKKFDNLSAN